MQYKKLRQERTDLSILLLKHFCGHSFSAFHERRRPNGRCSGFLHRVGCLFRGFGKACCHHLAGESNLVQVDN